MSTYMRSNFTNRSATRQALLSQAQPPVQEPPKPIEVKQNFLLKFFQLVP